MVLALLISDEMPQPLMEARMPFTELSLTMVLFGLEKEQ